MYAYNASRGRQYLTNSLNMKLKSLFLTLLVMAFGAVNAQVTSGKVYRIFNAKYENVITESLLSHKLSCVKPGGKADYQEMWKITLEEDGKYSIMNVYTHRYIHNQATREAQYETGTDKVNFVIEANEGLPPYYNIDIRTGNNWGLHCNGSNNVVPWNYGTDVVSATEWYFSEVAVTEEEMAAAYAEYAAFNDVVENSGAIVETVNALFEDKAGTALKAEYASKSDEELRALMEGVPAELQDAVLKIKNNSWATEERENLSEKNFRIYDYKPYSNPEEWANILFTRAFNRINNPTGISTYNDKSLLYVFVDEIPEGTEVYLSQMQECRFWGNDTKLVEGLNVVPAAYVNGSLFVRYVCDTHTGKLLADGSGVDLTKGKKLSDYPALKVHIEGGYVNGFWSKERGHTNEDWVYMTKNMFKNPMAVQAVGDHTVLNFRKQEFLNASTDIDPWGYKEQGCPEKIVEVMAMWDFWNERQKHYMNLEKYAEYCNNKQLAMSDDGGFMDASQYRTHYNNNTLTTIVNLDRITRDAGSAWGPNHEIGHTNQYAFEIVGTSEVSNNALANFVIFDQGTHTSRGQSMKTQIESFEKKIPYVGRGEGEYGTQLFSMTRMYFQLFLYFHAIGHDKEFYPKLFERLRYDRLVGWTVTSKDEFDENGYYINSVNAAEDQLKFVETCCEISNTDLTEFFEAWGFFIPMKNQFVGDYGHHWVYLKQEDIDACKARIKAKNYPKKGGHLMFLEDRVKKSPYMVNEELDAIVGLSEILKNETYIKDGYRGNYADWEGERIGEVGSFGQWNDYLDESVKAENYYYSVSSGTVTIVEGNGAKGAVGFKMYDKETGELLTYTNTYKMNIPAKAAGKELRVVAAQANGEDAEVKPASEGPLEMQLDALKVALDRAYRYSKRVVKKGYEIGHFYPEAVTELTEMYSNAKKDYDNRNVAGYTPAHSYADWSVMLVNECDRLLADESTRKRLEEGMSFVMLNEYSSNRVLIYSYEGLLLSNSVDMFDYDAAGWTLEYTGIPNTFYIKNNSNGKYIRTFTRNNEVFCDAGSTVQAAMFTFDYTEDGEVYFTTVGETPISFGAGTADLTEGKVVVGVGPAEEASLWTCYVKEDNSDEFYKNELEDAAANAGYIVAEVVNEENLGTPNIFNDNVIVKNTNLTQYATDLHTLHATVKADLDNAAMHRTYLAQLRDLFHKIEGTYVLSSPMQTAGENVVLYRLYDNATGDCLSVSTKSSTKDRLVTVGSNKADEMALWSFASTGKPGEYNMYNYGSEGFIYRMNEYSSVLYSKKENCIPVKISYDSENGGVVIALSDRVFSTDTKGNVTLKLPAAGQTLWTLELACIEKNKELADHIITNVEDVVMEGVEGVENDEIYDLSGRKVINPAKGIYIQNGKKIYFK